MLVFVSLTFMLFWVAYRHNYYYVQRNKVDTHGLIFNNAISQLFAGIYVLEIALIGLFFLVRDSRDKAVCSPQAIIMIVVLILTAAFHFVMERHLRPLYEFLPVTLEDKAVDAENRRLLLETERERSPERNSSKDNRGSKSAETSPLVAQRDVNTAANARKTLSRLTKKIARRATELESLGGLEPSSRSHRQGIATQLGASLASYPDELTDLSPEERETELKAAFQDPATRELAPVIWLPQDEAGIAEDAVRQSRVYGKYLEYSNEGAFLTAAGKCEVVRPAPDVRPDWLLDWVL